MLQLTANRIAAGIYTTVLVFAGCAEITTVEIPADSIRETVDIRFEKHLQQMVEEERFTGVALVMQDNQVIHAKGYGAATSSHPNTVGTEFHVASITKQFTAAAIMQLVESGAVKLDASINAYLPGPYKSPKWDSVSVHHLLSHSSGITDYAVTRDYYEVVAGFCLGDTVDGMVREAMGKDLEFSPGSQYSYTNLGYTLLGFIIENQSQTRYDDYINENILIPMGMNSSRIHTIGHIPTANEAAGYRWSTAQNAHIPDDVVSLPVTAPDGGLVTTLSDFIKWSRLYLGGAQYILSQDSIDQMSGPSIDIGRGGPLDSMGYGLYVGDRLIGHSGYIVGFRSHFIVDRETATLIVVFSNNTHNDPLRISFDLLTILFAPDS